MSHLLNFILKTEYNFVYYSNTKVGTPTTKTWKTGKAYKSCYNTHTQVLAPWAITMPPQSNLYSYYKIMKRWLLKKELHFNYSREVVLIIITPCGLKPSLYLLRCVCAWHANAFLMSTIVAYMSALWVNYMLKKYNTVRVLYNNVFRL